MGLGREGCALRSPHGQARNVRAAGRLRPPWAPLALAAARLRVAAAPSAPLAARPVPTPVLLVVPLLALLLPPRLPLLLPLPLLPLPLRLGLRRPSRLCSLPGLRPRPRVALRLFLLLAVHPRL